MKIRESLMRRGTAQFVLSLLFAAIGMPAKAIELTDARFLSSLTYADFQALERDSPELAFAYLKGMSEGIFAFRLVEKDLYTFCPPRGTSVDPELMQLLATNEIRLHGGDTNEYFMDLVKRGLLRAFPRVPENCDQVSN